MDKIIMESETAAKMSDRDSNKSDNNDVKKRKRSKHKLTPLGDKKKHVDTAEEVLEKVVLGADAFAESKQKQRDKHKKRRKRGKVQPETAWKDKDDAELQIKLPKKHKRLDYFKGAPNPEVTAEKYKQTLNSKYREVVGTPSWSKLRWERSDSEDDDSDTESTNLLQSTGNYLEQKPSSLSKRLIQIKKCADANVESPSSGKIHSVEFHPSAQVILTAGMDRTLRLFQVDGKYNSMIQSVHLEKFPIYTAHFSSDGKEVIAGSQYKSFYYYDMIAGKVINVPRIKGIEDCQMKKFIVSPDGKHLAFQGRYGYIHLLSAKSKEWISSVKMNGSVDAITFNNDGSRMLSHGDDGRVYVWDMNTRDCIHQFVDEGCVHGTDIAISPNGRYIATGSNSGVVNLYDESCLSNHYPLPLRAVPNLTTSCSMLQFNPTTEILAMASNEVESAIKLLHVSSQTVFSNYPEPAEKLRKAHSMDFSLNSGYFTVGDDKGHAHLYRVQHYANY